MLLEARVLTEVELRVSLETKHKEEALALQAKYQKREDLLLASKTRSEQLTSQTHATVTAFHELFASLQQKTQHKAVDKPKTLYEVIEAIKKFQTRTKLRTAAKKLATQEAAFEARQREFVSHSAGLQLELDNARATCQAMEEQQNKLLKQLLEANDLLDLARKEKMDLLADGIGATSADPKSEIKHYPPLLEGKAPHCTLSHESYELQPTPANTITVALQNKFRVLWDWGVLDSRRLAFNLFISPDRANFDYKQLDAELIAARLRRRAAQLAAEAANLSLHNLLPGTDDGGPAAPSQERPTPAPEPPVTAAAFGDKIHTIELTASTEDQQKALEMAWKERLHRAKKLRKELGQAEAEEARCGFTTLVSLHHPHNPDEVRLDARGRLAGRVPAAAAVGGERRAQHPERPPCVRAAAERRGQSSRELSRLRLRVVSDAGAGGENLPRRVSHAAVRVQSPVRRGRKAAGRFVPRRHQRHAA
jgi:hypothetical protein